MRNRPLAAGDTCLRYVKNPDARDRINSFCTPKLVIWWLMLPMSHPNSGYDTISMVYQGRSEGNSRRVFPFTIQAHGPSMPKFTPIVGATSKRPFSASLCSSSFVRPALSHVAYSNLPCAVFLGFGQSRLSLPLCGVIGATRIGGWQSGRLLEYYAAFVLDRRVLQFAIVPAVAGAVVWTLMMMERISPYGKFSTSLMMAVYRPALRASPISTANGNACRSQHRCRDAQAIGKTASSRHLPPPLRASPTNLFDKFITTGTKNQRDSTAPRRKSTRADQE